MLVERIDGLWIVDAPWLAEPIVAGTWFEAWERAMRVLAESNG